MADQSHDPIDDWLGARLAILKVGPRRSLLLYAVGAAIGLGLAGIALFTAEGTRVKSFPPEVIALVNGRQILRSDFYTQAEVEMGVPFEQVTPDQRRKVLDDMIAEELVVQRGLETDLAASDPDVRAAMVSGVNIQVDADIVARQPTQAELRAYYEKHIERYSSDGTMRLRDLLVPGVGTTPEAMQAVGEAAAAAFNAGTPVESVIARYGLKDSDLIDREDNFDFGVKAKLGQTIYDAAAKLNPGRASAPIRQPDGLHIIVMVDRVPSVKLDFEKAQDNVWQDFKREARLNVEKANLNFLKGRADIVVAPEYRK